ncbi:MAG: tyrosine-type recombinase/integrase [Spirochaetia bacterium]|jgi:hypothetical protein
MNELTIPAGMAECFPTIVEGLKMARDIFRSIKSFEDVERLFLKGAGLSPNTYRAYLGAVKQFYVFTKGINPLQVRPGDIESFFDDQVKHIERNTAYLRIRGLKKFFEGVCQVIPIYTSPFEVMSDKLHAKLNKTKKGNATKKALTTDEVKALLGFLRLDITVTGRENYAMVYMLATSGLRASELCQLKWGDLDFASGKWTARFVGKGAKDAEQELFPRCRGSLPAVLRRSLPPRSSPRRCAVLDCPRLSPPGARAYDSAHALDAGQGHRRRRFGSPGDHARAPILPAPVPQVIRNPALQERNEAQGDPEPNAARQHRNAVQALR